jgi:hypothetical protein
MKNSLYMAMIGAAGFVTLMWPQGASASVCGPINDLNGSNGLTPGCEDTASVSQSGYYSYLYATNSNGDYTEAIWITSGNQGSIGTESSWNHIGSGDYYYGTVILNCSNGGQYEGVYEVDPSADIYVYSASTQCPSGTQPYRYNFLVSVL